MYGLGLLILSSENFSRFFEQTLLSVCYYLCGDSLYITSGTVNCPYLYILILNYYNYYLLSINIMVKNNILIFIVYKWYVKNLQRGSEY